MNPSKPNDKQTHKSSKQSTNADKKIRSAPKNTVTMDTENQRSTSSEASKDKSVTDLFPWLKEAADWNIKYLGSIGESQARYVLQAMDFVIENLSTDYDKYYKSPKIARPLASHLRRLIFSYHNFLDEYKKDKDYFQRMASLLASLTDLELLASVLGKELDADVANRLQMLYATYLKSADETCILDLLMNVKRVLRLHGSIVNPLLKYNLVNLAITEPAEVSDDLFIKHLIPFKKWFAIANFPEERETIRNRFITQIKQPKSLKSNPTYALLLPAEKSVTEPTEHFVHLLDTKYSIEPLLLTFKPPSSDDLPNIHVNEINEVFEILSDDEDDCKIKVEPVASIDEASTSNTPSDSKTVDLIDDMYEEIEWPEHVTSWMPDLLYRAKVNASTIHRRLQVASMSQEIIVIDDVEAMNSDEIEIPTQPEDEPQNANVSIDSDKATTSNNQSDQQEQTNDGNTQKQLNNSKDQSTDSISLDVSQIDDDLVSPLEKMRTCSIDIGSDMPEEQKTNIDLGSGKVSEQHAEMDKVDDNTELALFLERMTTNDFEIKNDSAKNELLSNRTIQTPPLFTDPVMTEGNVMNEDLVDNVQVEQPLTEQSSIQGDDSTKNYQLNAVNRVNNNKQLTIEVLHPIRHTEWNDIDESNPMSNEPEVLTTTQCSMPSAQIKTNTLTLRNSDKQNKRPEQSQQNDQIDIDSTNSDRNGKLIFNSIQKMSPNPNSDRTTTSRSAQTQTNDTNNISDTNVPLVNRQKMTEQIDNDNIPSTIMERKTYIKPVNVGTNSTNKSQQQFHCRLSSQASPTTSDLKNEQQQQHQHKQKTSSKNAAPASVKQPPKTYKVFHSGTDLNLGLNDLGNVNVLSSDWSSQITNQTQMNQIMNTTHCENDNNCSCSTENEPNNFMYIAKTSPQKGRNNWSNTSLPSAIVHPLGLESSSKFSGSNGTATAAKLTVENLLAANVSAGDDKMVIESNSVPEMPLNENANDTSMENNPQLLMQFYKEIGDQLKNMGYSTKNKSLMHATNRLREEEESSSATYSPEPNEDSGDYASLPFKKRRKLHSNDDHASRLIKEEDINSQSPFDSTMHAAPVSLEIETTPTSNQRNAANVNVHSVVATEERPKIAQLAAYPSTQMLSIANVIEYLPIRAYSTLKTPAPEIAPVHFNIIPPQQRIVNPSLYPNVLATQNTTAGPQGPITNTTRSQSNQHVEFERTFNLIPPQQTITSSQASSQQMSASPNVPMNCSIVDGEPYLTQQIQTLGTDNSSNGYNLTTNNPIQYHQTFHPNNQPYAATYSIQPTSNTTNNLSANFDIQNMFNLRNYQMTPQNYHNLVQNSRINLQEKQALLLNDLVNSFSEGNQYENQQQNFQQQQQQQQQQHYQNLQQSSQTMHMPMQMSSVESKSSSTTMNKTMALRTKAARKIIPESEQSAENQKQSNENEERTPRRSNRTTRAQNLMTEHRSPPTSKSSTKRESKSRKHKAPEPIMISTNNAFDMLKKKKSANSK